MVQATFFAPFSAVIDTTRQMYSKTEPFEHLSYKSNKVDHKKKELKIKNGEHCGVYWENFFAPPLSWLIASGRVIGLAGGRGNLLATFLQTSSTFSSTFWVETWVCRALFSWNWQAFWCNWRPQWVTGRILEAVLSFWLTVGAMEGRSLFLLTSVLLFVGKKIVVFCAIHILCSKKVP